jgi:hypothetical protein
MKVIADQLVPGLYSCPEYLEPVGAPSSQGFCGDCHGWSFGCLISPWFR